MTRRPTVAVLALLAAGGWGACSRGGTDDDSGRIVDATDLDAGDAADAFEPETSDGRGRSDVDTDAVDGQDAGEPTLADRRKRVSRLELDADPFITESCQQIEPTERQREWLNSTGHCVGDGSPLFRDATAASGLVHRNAYPSFQEGGRDYALAVGGGVAVADFNSDGWLDVFATGWANENHLFLNAGQGDFYDCTDRSGVAFADDRTNGVSAADYDGDGDQDLYLANVGRDRLLENTGDAVFRDVTSSTGLRTHGRSSSASWGDVDLDGDLDLVVASALEVDSLADDLPVEEKKLSGLYENTGGGEFVDRTALVRASDAPVFQSSFLAPLVDLNNDRRVEILWTTEFGPNVLSLNDGPGGSGWVGWSTRSEAASVEHPHAAMGVGVLDVDRNGAMDLSISNLWGAPPMREVLLVNQGDATFVDEADRRGAFSMIRARTSPFARGASWGINALDVENDGDSDLYIVYGRLLKALGPLKVPLENSPRVRARQPNALLIDDGSGNFSGRSGSCAEGRGRGRGVARGDLDGDGCVDLVVSNQAGMNRLFLNRCDGAGHFLELRLVGTRSSRDPVGARVEIEVDGDSQYRQVLAGSRGVHSSSPRRLHVGLDDARVVDRVHVVWPSGASQTFTDVRADQRFVIREPSGAE